MNYYSIDEENRILNEFVSYITSNDTFLPKVYHWGNIEPYLFNKKYVGTCHINWIDLHKIFRDRPIVVKGAKDFKLKSIANAMKDQGFISRSFTWNDSLNNGITAMIMAIKYYKKCNNDPSIMNEIIRYNEVDCRVLWEIVNYLS